jgi:glucose dehydrogenase
MNTGDHLWSIPNGVVPDRIRNHPELRGIDLSNAGNLGRGITMVTGSLLLHAEGSAGEPLLHAVDKRTGERIGSVEIPAPGSYGMMSYMHEGRQYVVVQISGRGIPGSLVALRLP